jgi:hypothetical protein
MLTILFFYGLSINLKTLESLSILYARKTLSRTYSNIHQHILPANAELRPFQFYNFEKSYVFLQKFFFHINHHTHISDNNIV